MARPTKPADNPLCCDTLMIEKPAALRIIMEPRNSSRTASQLLIMLATNPRDLPSPQNLPICIYGREVSPKISVHPPFIFHSKAIFLSVGSDGGDTTQRFLKMCIN